MVQINKVIDKIYSFLKSLTLAVILLSLIAFFSAVGTIAGNVKFLKDLGLDNVYYSKWFLLLIVLFVVNLVLCTLSMIPVTIALFSPSAPNKTYKSKKENAKEHLIALLKSKKLYVQEKDNLIAAYRYPVRKFAVYGIHFGILIIAFGALVGSIWGFRGIMEIPQDQSSSIIITRNNYVSLPFAIYNKNFTVSFYKDKNIPSEYKTTGYILDNNQKIPFTTTVNHPFVYKGVWFYQASYQLNPHKSFIALNINGTDKNLYLHKPLLFDDAQFYLANLSYYNSKPIALLYVELPQGSASGWIKLGDSANLGPINIAFSSAEESYITVLSVAKDPGSTIVILGFLAVIASLLLIFFKFRRRVYRIKKL
ncbi:Cytochrome c-type biogenesis protein Ccs1/ResB [Desulfurella amilsii]|uniref:Cytochrome c-type biogenesis protein Ccs1/ResB n=1 Tax=Desulfurella amilsii TaxID=1562698 RepID=A0A1X4XW64_9BACT|nr:cytochrome c biogenesis protein ResB [Desulfurella amilsii]OSS41773.1 Cytochrome c-type biogenesis protein Ccs1/ResB [Desulfurella amilsii]